MAASFDQSAERRAGRGDPSSHSPCDLTAARRKSSETDDDGSHRQKPQFRPVRHRLRRRDLPPVVGHDPGHRRRPEWIAGASGCSSRSGATPPTPSSTSACLTGGRSPWAGRYRCERHRAPRCRGVDIDPDAAAGRRRRRARVGARVHRERPAHDPGVGLQRRRPLAGGDCHAAPPPLEQGAVLDGARARHRDRHRSRRAGAGAGDQRRGERVQRRPAADPGQGQAQRPGRRHQQRERLPRHVEGARDRHHQGRRHGVGRRRRCRSLGVRGGHALLLGASS